MDSAIITDKIEAPGHHVPEAWLRARVRGWMEMLESPDEAYWIGTYTAEGKWIYCSSSSDMYAPKAYRQLYAMNVCAHVNKHVSNGGAWLAGWVRGGREFFLLYKDSDGDIQIPIECDKPWIVLRGWDLTVWERQCATAMAVWTNWKKDLELKAGQTVKAAQGEQPSPGHENFMPPVAR